MVVLLGGQKSGRNNEVTIRQGSTVFVNQEIITVAVSSLLWCKVKCSIAKVQNKRMSPLEQNNITLTKPAP